ncbi:MAG: DUF3604 domain-containing protein [Acidobacteria bacterium]|nr:DUF3604 domain-containing protein [Acidobacteriota bacterium]
MSKRRRTTSRKFPAAGPLRAAPPALAVFLSLTVLACTDTSLSVDDYAEAPPPASQTEGYSEHRNVYFGDVHIHTRYSFDAYLLGTDTTPDESYRFAKGEAIENTFGDEMKLREPLDFFAVSDHGFFLGMVPQWADPTTRVGQLDGAEAFHGVNEGDNLHPYSVQMRSVLFRQSFGRQMRTDGGFLRQQRARMANHPQMQYASFDDQAHRSAWEDSILAAERHNDPGNFTTFIAYEWTSSTPAPESAAYHRNVIFAGSKAPARPFTRIDSHEPEQLWSWMDRLREQGVDSLAIPHNMNQSHGQVFRLKYSDGRAVDNAFAEQRMRNEPLVELTQVKGTSETHPKLSPDDEWADFEILNTRKGKITAHSDPSRSYARQALVSGLALEQEGRGNPFKIGFIGSSDTHNGAPSFDESNEFGSSPVSGTAENRGSVPVSRERLDYIAGLPPAEQAFGEVVDDALGPYFGMRRAQFSASGLAAVWAEENTRDAIFQGLRRKETYATSGTRIRLRFFGGFEYDDLDPASPDLVGQAYAGGVPMGGDLVAETAAAPRFLVWAQRDKLSAPLQRLQVVKGWYDSGYRKETREQVYDVACADGGVVDPDTHRCPDNGATVDLSDCSFSEDLGAGELAAVWEDPDFDPGTDAVYYVRVLENPTCRWTTWDALRAGVQPRGGVAATIQERAWSSPIWYYAPR